MISVRKQALFAVCNIILGVMVAHGQPGSAGFSMLKLGVSGRGTAMSDAMAASVEGAAAAYYNPAGILRGGTTELMFMHREWIQDTRTEYFGAAISVADGEAIGFSLLTTTIADIEVRERPGPAAGTFTARDLAMGGSYAHQFTSDLRVGASMKFLYQKMFVDEAAGFAFDAGAQWQSPLPELHVGLALTNAGRMDALRTERTTLPTLLRGGAAYEIPAEEFHILLAADAAYNFPEKKLYPSFGAEGIFAQLVALRLGYQAGSETRGLSFGLGLHHGIFGLDYSFAALSADLGTTHAVSLEIGF